MGRSLGLNPRAQRKLNSIFRNRSDLPLTNDPIHRKVELLSDLCPQNARQMCSVLASERRRLSVDFVSNPSPPCHKPVLSCQFSGTASQWPSPKNDDQSKGKLEHS